MWAADASLINGNMETWTSSTACTEWDNWFSTAGTCTRSTDVYAGTYAMKLQAVDSTQVMWYQSIETHESHNLAYWKGRHLAIGGWVKSNTSSCLLALWDGVTFGSQHVPHSGGGAYEWMQSTILVDASATLMFVFLQTPSDNSLYAIYDNLVLLNECHIRKVHSIPSSRISKINGIAVSGMSKINGVTG
jgi:hypothetical protein